jgi:hypothetical protein
VLKSLQYHPSLRLLFQNVSLHSPTITACVDAAIQKGVGKYFQVLIYRLPDNRRLLDPVSDAKCFVDATGDIVTPVCLVTPY